MSKALVKTKGIIVRSIKYKESSLLLDIYTEELGMRRCILNSVRKKNARIGSGTVQLMTLVSLVIFNNPRSELVRVQEIQVNHPYVGIPFNQYKSLTGLFVLEVLQKTLKEPEPNPELFNFIESFFKYLDADAEVLRNIPTYFLVQFSNYLGIQIYGDYSSQTPWIDFLDCQFVEAQPAHNEKAPPALAHYFSKLQTASLEEQADVNVEKKLRTHLLNCMVFHFNQHIPNFGRMKTLDILPQLMF